VVATLGTGALNALVVFFLPANPHVSASWLGTMDGAMGLGAIAGALLTGIAARRLGQARVFGYGVVIIGLLLLAFSRATQLAVALGVLALCGAALGAVNTVVPPLLLAATPQHLIGRVMAVINPAQQLASIVSMAVAGLLASTVLRGFHTVIAGVAFGPYDTVFGVAALLILAAGIASIAGLRGAAAAAASSAPASAPARSGS
jgi:MFS family permease